MERRETAALEITGANTTWRQRIERLSQAQQIAGEDFPELFYWSGLAIVSYESI